MEKLILFFVFSLNVFSHARAGTATAAVPTIIKKWTLPADYKINKKRVGGLSGCSLFEDQIYFVSDDRGGEGGPRIFKFKFDQQKQEIDFTKNEVIAVKTNADSKILDLEGIAVLEKNKILLSSEGDLGQKPRVMPSLFWINSKGDRTSSITMPSDYIPEKSGQQTKGIQNNLAFEGLAIDTDLKKWAAALEAPLMQDRSFLKFIESDLGSNKFDQIYTYPIPTPYSSNPESIPGMNAYFGISDILFLTADSFLVLERGVEFSALGFGYHTQFCEATKGKNQELSRRCFYAMNDDEALKSEIPTGANFEGLCWVNKQKKQFIVVSDNNFSKTDKTIFLLYQLN